MRTLTIPGSELVVSRFIFGTGSLFNAGDAAARQRLLHSAAEAGFTHFDTAPYYGFGLAERDLAPVLRAHPHVTLTTKVGIYSPGGEEQGAARVFLRKALGRAIPAISRPTIDFAVARARGALEGSLRRTGRERMDLYTLHEPSLPLLVTDEWQRWLEDCVSAGKVREFGMALTRDQLQPFLAAGVRIGTVIQLADSLDAREADILAAHGLPMQITYSYIGHAAQAGNPLSPPEVAGAALRRNRHGAVIVSTRKPERCATFAAIAAEADR